MIKSGEQTPIVSPVPKLVQKLESTLAAPKPAPKVEPEGEKRATDSKAKEARKLTLSESFSQALLKLR